MDISVAASEAHAASIFSGEVSAMHKNSCAYSCAQEFEASRCGLVPFTGL
jgi:hypothetical protein